MLAPLFTKYKTENRHYLYDCGTGRIIDVDEVVHAIIDDWMLLTEEELLATYASFGSDRVRTAIADIRSLEDQGYLAPHAPAELSPIDIVLHKEERSPIGEFWQKTAVLLVLSITERCNLCCSYCCFSGHFEGQRTHSNRSMSWEIAEKAMSYFLENDQVGEDCPITFYGGEPLLEWELIQKCVAYAEQKAAALGKNVRFSITTNGTLLNDEVADYLAAHDFLTMISLDGPQVAHDRYRLFPNAKGSFEIIERNLRRFAERWPDHKNRGLNVTLAPPLDLDATARLIEELYPHYPMSRAALVNTGTEFRFREDQGTPTRYGCHSSCKQDANPLHDPFRDFGDNDFRQLRERWTACMECITEHGVTKAREIMPFSMLMFEQQVAFYHRRKVTKRARDWYFYIPCIPGFTRRFCDVDGNYRVCERVDDSHAYRMGNVWDGPDPAKLRRTMELRRHFGDCANCTALKTCDVCYARIPDSDAVDSGFDPLFDLQCQRTRVAASNFLQTYCAIMEAKPDAFHRPEKRIEPESEKLKYGTLANRPDEALLQRLKRESL